MTRASAAPLNPYHKWAYIDEVFAAINQDLPQLSANIGLPAAVIKIIRTLGFLEGVSFAIFNSFCHPNHPEQVDIYKQCDWSESLKEMLENWHHIFHVFLQHEMKNSKLQKLPQNKTNNVPLQLHPKFDTEPLASEKQKLKNSLDHWAKKHASIIFQENGTATDWQNLINFLVDHELILAITNDQSLDPIKQKYAHIEPFFRGIHQMTEIAMNIIVDYSLQLHHEIKQLKVHPPQLKLDPAEYQQIVSLRQQMKRLQQWWEIAASHIMLLSKMDTGSYAEYRQTLLGTSGGDSKQLRQLKSITSQLHFALPDELKNIDLAAALNKNSADPLLNQLLSAIRELQAASADFWLRHFTLTANTIGIIRGSQGLPVEKLIYFATGPLMRKDSLLQAVGHVGENFAKTPEAFIVKIDEKEKIIGSTILPHLKNQVEIIREHRAAPSEQKPLLDLLELRPLELNDDTKNSPYASWFQPDIHAYSTHFGMHSFGTPLNIFHDSIANTASRLMNSQNAYWEIFFADRIAQLEKILFKLLDIPTHYFTVSIDANVTALLERLLSALPKHKEPTILTTQQEFLTVNRALASHATENTFNLEKINIHPDVLNIAPIFHDAIKKIGNKLQLVIFSQVISTTQIGFSENEITQIIDAIPAHVPVIIDATQGVFNVPMSWEKIVKNRTNIYLLGSAIKHGRSGSGLGFLIAPKNNSVLKHPKKTGWCAYLSGLAAGKTTDDQDNLLYDEPLQWLGGTPANIFAIEIFINTWDAILRTGETLQSMHHYVQSLQHYFFQLLTQQKELLNEICVIDQSRREAHPHFSSNVIALRLSTQQAEKLSQYAATQGIHFDHRENDIVRIGFGIQHSQNDVKKLLTVLQTGLHTIKTKAP